MGFIKQKNHYTTMLVERWKNRIVTILAVVVVAIIVIGSLLFFVVFQDEKSKFIGTWKLEIDEEHYAIITFHSNNSANNLLYTYINDSTPRWDIQESWHTYYIKDNILYQNYNDTLTRSFYFKFSNDNKNLELTNTKSGYREIWIKQ